MCCLEICKDLWVLNCALLLEMGINVETWNLWNGIATQRTSVCSQSAILSLCTISQDQSPSDCLLCQASAEALVPLT